MNRLKLSKSIVESTYGISLYKGQLYGAKLAQGCVAVNLPTGFGKTYTTILTALTKLGKVRQVVIVCTNEYLVQRDMSIGSKLWDSRNIKYTYISERTETLDGFNVVYTTPEDLVFFYLRKGSGLTFESCIIDEVDYVLIENALSNFTISNGEEFGGTADIDSLNICKRIYNTMSKGFCVEKDTIEQELFAVKFDIVYDVSTVYITTKGLLKLSHMFNCDSFIETYGELYDTFTLYCQAKLLLTNGRDYMVDSDGQVTVINIYNGRGRHGCKFGNQLHNVVEFIEGVPLSARSSSARTMCYSVFFNLFKHLCGFSGTVHESMFDLSEVFGLRVKTVKSHYKDRLEYMYTPLRSTVLDKCGDLIDIIKNGSSSGVTLVSVYDEDELSVVRKFLEDSKVTAQYLSNENIEFENELLCEFEKQGGILVTTKIVSRGTDLSFIDSLSRIINLEVILFSPHIYSSIDRQIAGRTGRQGRYGRVYCLSCTEDSLFIGKDVSSSLVDKMRTCGELRNVVLGIQSGNEIEAYNRRVDNHKKYCLVENFVRQVELLGAPSSVVGSFQERCIDEYECVALSSRYSPVELENACAVKFSSWIEDIEKEMSLNGNKVG